MNIIEAIRTGRFFEAEQIIREGLKRNMLRGIYENCAPVMKSTYGPAGAGLVNEDEIEFVDDEDEDSADIDGDVDDDADDLGIDDVDPLDDEEADMVGDEDEDMETVVFESRDLTEARDKAGWQAYIGKLGAAVTMKDHEIASARQRVADLKKKKAKPESITKANETLKKKIEALSKAKQRLQAAQTKFREWLQKDAEKKRKANERARKAATKPAPKTTPKK